MVKSVSMKQVFNEATNRCSGAQLPSRPLNSGGAFTATGGNHKVDLSWTNPSDSDFVEVEIRRSTQGFPATPTSGNHVYNCACQSYQDTGRTNGTTYYYSIFARDEVPNYSTAATDSATPPNP